MKYEVVKLGFCPIGKFVFSHGDAKRFKFEIENKLNQMGVNYVGIDGVIPDGIVRSYDHVDPVVKYLKTQNIACAVC